MGILRQQTRYQPSQNGLTTPTDDRTSIPTGWEFEQVKDADRISQYLEKKYPPPKSFEDKIFYIKEPISRILDKLSLENLMDVMNDEQQQKPNIPKREYSKQYEPLEKLVNGLEQKNVVKDSRPLEAPPKPPRAQKTVGASTATPPSIPSPAPPTGPAKPSHSTPAVPTHQRLRTYSYPPQQHDSHIARTNSRKSPDCIRSKSCGAFRTQDTDTLHGFAVLLTGDNEHVRATRSQDHLSTWTSADNHFSDQFSNQFSDNHHSDNHLDQERPRTRSEGLDSWQAGRTHKWILDNNTTLVTPDYKITRL